MPASQPARSGNGARVCKSFGGLRRGCANGEPVKRRENQQENGRPFLFYPKGRSEGLFATKDPEDTKNQRRFVGLGPDSGGEATIRAFFQAKAQLTGEKRCPDGAAQSSAFSYRTMIKGICSPEPESWKSWYSAHA